MLQVLIKPVSYPSRTNFLTPANQMRLDWTHALKPATPQKVVRPKEDPAELA